MTYDNWKTTNPADAELVSMSQELMTLSEQIEAALKRAPKGLTSRELAEAIGKNMDTVSACAYRLLLKGKVDRQTERLVRQSQMVCSTYRWRAKGQ